MTEDEADKRFADFLAVNKLSPCKCGRHIDRGDVAWNNACTDAGTPYSFVEIQCLNCQSEITSWDSWWPEMETFEEMIEHVLPDWRIGKRT